MENEIGSGSEGFIKGTAYPKVPNGRKMDNLGVGNQRKLKFLGKPSEPLRHGSGL